MLEDIVLASSKAALAGYSMMIGCVAGGSVYVLGRQALSVALWMTT